MYAANCRLGGQRPADTRFNNEHDPEDRDVKPVKVLCRCYETYTCGVYISCLSSLRPTIHYPHYYTLILTADYSVLFWAHGKCDQSTADAYSS
jgi:hypothetical protein